MQNTFCRLFLMATLAVNASAAYRPKIYLGGPDVFFPTSKESEKLKKKIAEKYGFEGVYPEDNEVPPQASPEETAFAIFQANVGLMRKSDLMIANMTSFRGPSMDAGTAFEMGFMMGLGKPVLAYTEDSALFSDRTKEYLKKAGISVSEHHHHLKDARGNSLENFGLVDNLMLPGSVKQSGAKVENSFEAVLKANAKRLLALFQR